MERAALINKAQRSIITRVWCSVNRNLRGKDNPTVSSITPNYIKLYTVYVGLTM